MTERQLFGGAIAAITPTDLIDASDMRQVPDNQEVLIYRDSGISIIVEILQSVEPVNSNEIARFHFGSLAHDNSATLCSVGEVLVIPNDRADNTPSPIVLTGIQHVSKFNHHTLDKVHVLMAVYRIDDKKIDLVVTFNVPTSSSDGKSISDEGLATAHTQFEIFVKSLRIIDFTLFA